MTKLEDIQKAVTHELDAQAWDEQIERDAKAGQLDQLAVRALADEKAGLTEEL